MAEKITVLIPEEEIDKRVRELAAQISKDYEGRKIRMVGILKGASFFMCELAKRITVPVSIDFMQVSSYGGATESTGTVRTLTSRSRIWMSSLSRTSWTPDARLLSLGIS